MTDQENDGKDNSGRVSNHKKEGRKERLIVLNRNALRAVFADGISIAESRISKYTLDSDANISDSAFSFSLMADLEEAIGFCVDMLIYEGFLALKRIIGGLIKARLCSIKFLTITMTFIQTKTKSDVL